VDFPPWEVSQSGDVSRNQNSFFRIQFSLRKIGEIGSKTLLLSRSTEKHYQSTDAQLPELFTDSYYIDLFTRLLPKLKKYSIAEHAIGFLNKHKKPLFVKTLINSIYI